MTYWEEVVKVKTSGGRVKQVKKERLGFGVIKNLYWHTLWPDTQDPKVIAECDWYQYLGTNPRNGLIQIRRHLLWNQDCSVVFLERCIALSCQFWPSDPFAEDENARLECMDVLLHHDLMPEFEKD
jgi:hypothetical protein